MKKFQAGIFKYLAWLLIFAAFISASAGPVQAAPKAPAKKAATYDAIVVGAGYSGLITAAILAKNGLKTLVVEELDQIGGRLGSSLYNGYWLDWGVRGTRDFADNFIIITKRGQYSKKAAEAAGVEVNWVGPFKPIVMMHRLADGKVVPVEVDAEGSARFATEALDLSAEQATKFLSIMKKLAMEDPTKWMNTSIAEWLSNIEDQAIKTAFLRLSMIHMADPLEESSVGRWILMLKDIQEVFKVDNREAGNHQGLMAAYAKIIRKHGGEIKLGLQTVEIKTEGSKVAGVVARDKISMIQEFRAPVVVFSQPIWDAFNVLDEKRFPKEVVTNARKQELGYRGDLMALNIGVKRLPKIKATGKQDTYIGFNQFIEETSGWYTPSLSSRKAAPPGKHLLALVTVDNKPFSYEEGKARLEKTKEYMRRYYADLDDVIEWETYQWPKMWGTAGYWKITPKSPVEVTGLDGLYFTGSTVDAPGVFQDVDASSALQAAQKILQQRGKTP